MEPWKLTLSCTWGLWMVTGVYWRLPGGSVHFSWQTDKHFIIIYISSSLSSPLPTSPSPTHHNLEGKPVRKAGFDNEESAQIWNPDNWLHYNWYNSLFMTRLYTISLWSGSVWLSRPTRQKAVNLISHLKLFKIVSKFIRWRVTPRLIEFFSIVYFSLIFWADAIKVVTFRHQLSLQQEWLKRNER